MLNFINNFKYILLILGCKEIDILLIGYNLYDLFGNGLRYKVLFLIVNNNIKIWNF